MQSYCRTTWEGLMRDMKHRWETVIHLGRFMKKYWDHLTLLLLGFYLPFAVLSYVLLRHFDNVRLFSIHHPLFLISATLLVMYVALNHLLLTLTILVVGESFKSLEESVKSLEESESEWTLKILIVASFDSVWRIILSDLLNVFFFCCAGFVFTVILVFTFMIWINLVMARSSQLNYVVSWILSVVMELETVIFMVWAVHNTLKVSVARPVATMEHLWGMTAIRRSAALVQGKKMTAITVLICVSVYAYASTNESSSTFFLAFVHDGPRALAVPLKYVLSHIGSVICLSLLATTITTVVYHLCRSDDKSGGLDLELAAYKPIPPYSAVSCQRVIHQGLQTTL